MIVQIMQFRPAGFNLPESLLFPKKLMLHSLDQKVLAMSKPLHTILEVIPNGSLVILEYEGEL